MHIYTEYMGILLQNICTGLELFWDDFPKTIPSETWTHPPTSIVFSDFFLFTAPKHYNLERYVRRSFSVAGPSLWNALPSSNGNSIS